MLALAALAACGGATAPDGTDPPGTTTSASPRPAESADPAESAALPADPTDAPVDLGDPDGYAAALVAGTDRVRVAEGLAPLTASGCAAEAALGRARALVGTSELQHAPMDGVLAACAPLTRAAENLSRAAAPADDVVEAWMGSPGHRQNLLSAEMTQIGVGCVPDGDRMLCSQVFLGP